MRNTFWILPFCCFTIISRRHDCVWPVSLIIHFTLNSSKYKCVVLCENNVCKDGNQMISYTCNLSTSTRDSQTHTNMNMTDLYLYVTDIQPIQA